MSFEASRPDFFFLLYLNSFASDKQSSLGSPFFDFIIFLYEAINELERELHNTLACFSDEVTKRVVTLKATA